MEAVRNGLKWKERELRSKTAAVVWHTGQNLGMCVRVLVWMCGCERDWGALNKAREGDWPLGIRSDNSWNPHTLSMLAFNSQNHSI